MPNPIKAATFGRIRRFVRGEGVRIVFQPISDLQSGTVVGFESLARFDPDRSTAAWFLEAAAAGLRRELELAAARAAVAAIEELPAGSYLTINASPDVVVDPEFISTIPVGAAERIVVEITEHVPIHDYDEFNGALAILRTRGVRVAIDDAGAGFSNLAHILRIDPDLIKLDVELTRHVDIDARRRALVRSLVSFARSVGATLIAEGIETEAELQALRSLGVTTGQGFHLGRPAPLPGHAEAAPTARRRAASLSTSLADVRCFLRTRRIARGRRNAFQPIAIAIVGTLVLAPAAFAVSDDAMPGSAAYWLKRRIESVRLVVALDRDARTRLHLEFARRRVNELSELVAEGRMSQTASLLDDYRKELEAVSGRLTDERAATGSLQRRIGMELNELTDVLAADRPALCRSAASPRPACRRADEAISRSKEVLARTRPGSARSGNRRSVRSPAPAPAPAATLHFAPTAGSHQPSKK